MAPGPYEVKPVSYDGEITGYMIVVSKDIPSEERKKLEPARFLYTYRQSAWRHCNRLNQRWQEQQEGEKIEQIDTDLPLSAWISANEASLEMSIRAGTYISPHDIGQWKRKKGIANRTTLYNRADVRKFPIKKRVKRPVPESVMDTWQQAFPATVRALRAEGYAVPPDNEALVKQSQQRLAHIQQVRDAQRSHAPDTPRSKQIESADRRGETMLNLSEQGMTYREIGNKYGISVERVSTLITRYKRRYPLS